MWHAQIDLLNGESIRKVTSLQGSMPLSFDDVLTLWGSGASFRAFVTGVLADSPINAYRRETPGVTTPTLDQPFEFVLLRSDSLVRTVDVGGLAEHMMVDASVVTFSNLSGDATLIMPCPLEDVAIDGHFTSFIYRAPQRQIHQLWILVATAMQSRICQRPGWLSTAGMGVSWLHVRLDDYPWYYGHAPYRKEQPKNFRSMT